MTTPRRTTLLATSAVALALAVEAVKAGRSVYFSPLADIIDSLARAEREGRLRDEIVPVKTADGIVDQDGTLRPLTTLEGLAGLKPAFRADGSVTAGTSSPLILRSH